jgi:hypothetical protein
MPLKVDKELRHPHTLNQKSPQPNSQELSTLPTSSKLHCDQSGIHLNAKQIIAILSCMIGGESTTNHLT